MVGRRGTLSKGSHYEKMLLYDTGRGTSLETESGRSSEQQFKEFGVDPGTSAFSESYECDCQKVALIVSSEVFIV